MPTQVGIAYVIVTTVLFLFPPELPATGSNMSKSAQGVFTLSLYSVTIPYRMQRTVGPMDCHEVKPHYERSKR